MNTSGEERSLIVGASGQVGTAICSAIEQRGGIDLLFRTSRMAREGWLTFDVASPFTEETRAVLDEVAPTAIFCVGGTTFVDGCEQSPEACMAANALGPAALAAYAQSTSVPFVFFSTDYVFSGFGQDCGPYDEGAPVQPLSAYGRSKLEGERLVLAADSGALIVRTTVVYGPDAAGKNFLYTLLRHLWTRTPLRVPADQISTPTYNRDLAQAVLALVDAGASGVVHVAGPELMDRLAFARQVATFFGLDGSKITGVSTESLGQIAARPLFSGLKTQRLEQLVPSVRWHTVQEALLDCEGELRRFLSQLTTGV